MKREYRAIVLFDLDNTLLNDAKQVSAANVDALLSAAKSGCLIGFSTGRNLYELNQLQCQLHIDTMVAGNGADVIVEGEQIYQSTMPVDSLTRLKRRADELCIPIGFYNSQHAAITMLNDDVRQQYRHIQQQPAPIQPAFYRHERVHMLHLYLPQTPEGELLAERMIQDFPEFTFYRNSKFSLDVVNQGITKATGLKRLLEVPALAPLPVYAFGDGNNDFEIIRDATYGIAMGNALPRVKAVADYVTADHQHAGVVQALVHFGLMS